VFKRDPILRRSKRIGEEPGFHSLKSGVSDFSNLLPALTRTIYLSNINY
jgi:hypothetical protein